MNRLAHTRKDGSSSDVGNKNKSFWDERDDPDYSESSDLSYEAGNDESDEKSDSVLQK